MKKGQTEPSLFQSRDPERRARQLANLKQNWTAERATAAQNQKDTDQYSPCSSSRP